jgi:hypothetical protein
MRRADGWRLGGRYQQEMHSVNEVLTEHYRRAHHRALGAVLCATRVELRLDRLLGMPSDER